MIILRKTEEILFDKCVNDDVAKHIGKTFIVFRKENSFEIIWYGLNANWKYVFDDKKWYKLVGSSFVESVIPDYEKKYLNMTRKCKLNNIINNYEE